MTRFRLPLDRARALAIVTTSAISRRPSAAARPAESRISRGCSLKSAMLLATALCCAACQQSEQSGSDASFEAVPAQTLPDEVVVDLAAGETLAASAEDVPLPNDSVEQSVEIVASETQPLAEVTPAGASDAATSTVETEAARSERPEPLLQDWDKPLVAIVLTGEQHGHLEPCGCSERQSGGLARRTELVRMLGERGWPVTGFDLGGTLKRTRRQSEMKLDYTREALNIMGYKGLGLGAEELQLGTLKLFDAFSRTQADETFDVPFISANVTFFDSRDLGTPLEYRVIEINGVTIGVTSVLGQSIQDEMQAAGFVAEEGVVTIDSVDATLPGVIERMRAEMGPPAGQPSATILLSYAKPEESRRIAEKYPVFDLVVTAGSPEDPDGRAEQIGNSLLLKVGEKGKHVGLVGLYPDHKFRFTTVELDRFRFGSAPEIDELMERYQERLADENLVANEPAIRHPFGEGYSFLGSEKCGECHDEEYDIWKQTPHAHAYESLTVAYAQASDDPSLKQRVRVDRIHDPECINCHTTGWDPQDVIRFEGGFTGIDRTPHLVGVNCENCHGPGSRHVELEEAGASDAELQAERDKLHLSVKTAELALCIKCHDGDNSPDFKFDTYWPKIEH